MSDTATVSALAADAVLVVHVLFVAFVVGGEVLILAGAWRGWAFVRGRLFRLLHLAAIGVVVLQVWLGQHCPLTILESRLRARAGEETYPGAFIAYWLHELLYIDAPDWVFGLVYTLFGALVLASWWLVPPRR